MTMRSLRPPNFQKRYFCLTDWRLNSTHRITENKKRQFDNFIVIGGTVSCHYDNLECHQWRQIVKLMTLCFQWWDGFFRQLFLIIHLDSFCFVNPHAGPSSKLGHQRFRKLAWPPGATFNKISLKINQFSSKKCAWIYCLQNIGHFVWAGAIYTISHEICIQLGRALFYYGDILINSRYTF